MPDPIWFWQRIVSPHMAGLAAGLAEAGEDVTYVAEQPMSADRAGQGWSAPELGAATLRLAPDRAAIEALVAAAPAASRHICQGFRGNGLVGVAQEALARRGLRQWVVMETVEEKGRLSAWLKRLEYDRLVRRRGDRLSGVLATGHATPEWLMRRGVPPERVFPFAYFLPDIDAPQAAPAAGGEGDLRFLFVGQFIERKRLDLLIEALGGIAAAGDGAAAGHFTLRIAGSGPLEGALRAQAERLLPGRFEWLGKLSQQDVHGVMATSDCLVLPSRHDGWGAVISEALMAGTPVICSDRCGAAGVVRLSGRGGVFRAGDAADLARRLGRAIAAGPATPAQRAALARWARCLGARAGADYLTGILEHRTDEAGETRPRPPWQPPAPGPRG